MSSFKCVNDWGILIRYAMHNNLKINKSTLTKKCCYVLGWQEKLDLGRSVNTIKLGLLCMIFQWHIKIMLDYMDDKISVLNCTCDIMVCLFYGLCTGCILSHYMKMHQSYRMWSRDTRHHIVSYIISYHIISYHVMSCHLIISCQLYDIIQIDEAVSFMISHIWYHMRPYHIYVKQYLSGSMVVSWIFLWKI